jgi:hypothetical protein
MNWLGALFAIAIALSGQDAFAKHRLTDPIKIALVRRTSPRWPAHHKLPQGEDDRIVAGMLGCSQINGITEAKAITPN